MRLILGPAAQHLPEPSANDLVPVVEYGVHRYRIQPVLAHRYRLIFDTLAAIILCAANDHNPYVNGAGAPNSDGHPTSCLATGSCLLQQIGESLGNPDADLGDESSTYGHHRPAKEQIKARCCQYAKEFRRGGGSSGYRMLGCADGVYGKTQVREDMTCKETTPVHSGCSDRKGESTETAKCEQYGCRQEKGRSKDAKTHQAHRGRDK
ncbi:hypothetical protein B0H14DRAFT_2619353 [Mycena olivaceomarginata]|nr:hypothetical protein B0H14DRAFT_2619353 [Mycena olivaceomarginata]